MIKESEKLYLLNDETLRQYDNTNIDEGTGEITGYWWRYNYSFYDKTSGALNHNFDLFYFDDQKSYQNNEYVEPDFGEEAQLHWVNTYLTDYDNYIAARKEEDGDNYNASEYSGVKPLFKQKEGAITVGGVYYLPSFSEEDIEPITVIYVTPENEAGFQNIKLGDKINGLVYLIEVKGHISDTEVNTNTDIGSNKKLGILKAYNYNNKTDYFHLDVSGAGDRSFDFYLNGQHVGHYPLEGFSDDWKNDHSLGVVLNTKMHSDAEPEIPVGVIRIIPRCFIDDSEVDNYLSEGNKYIDFDISGGTTELEAWMQGFQNNIYLYDLGNDDLSGQFAPNEFTWEISEVKLIGSERGNSFIETVNGQTITVNLTATDANTLTDGTNDYRLQQMGDFTKSK